MKNQPRVEEQTERFTAVENWNRRTDWDPRIRNEFFLGIFLFEQTPLKINMEHNHGGLVDHFLF